MNLSGLLPVLFDAPAVRELVARPNAALTDVTATAGVRPALLAAISRPALVSEVGPRRLVVVTATGREAEDLTKALAEYLPADTVALLPAWETLPHERLSPRADTVAQRLAVFRRLAHPEPAGPYGPVQVLVAPVRALIQPVVADLGQIRPVEVRTGDQVDISELAAQLVAAAYQRVDMVERRGEFAVRGGIIDVFSPVDEHPVRLELWGDTVEEMRWFSVADQRSVEVTDRLWAPACRELLLTEPVRARAAALGETAPELAEMTGKLAAGIAVEGMESLTAALVPNLVPVLDLVDPQALVVAVDPERLRRRVTDLMAVAAEFLTAAWSGAAAGGRVPIDLSAGSFASWEETLAQAQRRGLGWWNLSSFGVDEELGGTASDSVMLAVKPVETYHGAVDKALLDLRRWQLGSWRIVISTAGAGSAQRLVEQLGAAQIPARFVTELGEAPQPGVVHVVTATTGTGFISAELKLALLSETDITGRTGSSTREMRKMPSRRRHAVDPLSLQAGDHVVHEQHGVGRFVELLARTIGTGPTAATREYLVIEYAASKKGQPGDRLFVPTDALDQVTRYVGGEAPSLSRMGGADWARTKGRARKAVREIAGELIRLYSARTATPGHAFGPDTPWQRELEDAFSYVETPDQLVTIDEVKSDMEKSVPMDRLICGDVGYGKTEIAVRAAFKAVQDGKQVVVLVPTTLLVQQHLETFTERYSPFPVTVRALSRFQTASESAAVVAGLADGSIDVVIGTHRLLTGQVRFKQLGLVIVDEEQRFGVEHKETLKAMRTNVDVLAMSATPIPRTLEMAVTGIREMSTLATPPEERHPVLTFVGPYDDGQIAAAIRREMLREGQVFYVHNRVASIDQAAKHLSELVPDARIAVAHGKMGEQQLEQVIVDFWERRFDVLVSTTIIETGLDISNANTLILERADQLGLSQLHQLRGRVGRGRDRAYAYFLYPPQAPLTQTAHDRLATIAANTDLGSGMAVAMKDLEIRGAGNLLGGEQSGHIEGVGFDLYVRMVSEAVREFRGEAEPQIQEVTIELPLDAHLPEKYVPTERLRLEAYRTIAAATGPAELEAVRTELVDRYGPVPEPVEILLAVAQLRQLARQVGVGEISGQGRNIRLAPVELAESAGMRLRRLYPGSLVKPAVRTVLIPFPMTARVGGKPLGGKELLRWLEQLVQAILVGDLAAAAAVGAR